MELSQKTFLVTGGGSGLGAACARMLAAQGANVILADVNENSGQALAVELGARARFIRTDVTEEAQVQQAIDLAVRTFGGLHGSVQCAGIVLGERVLGKTGPHPLASFAKVIQVNLIGTFNVVRLAAAAMANNAPTPAGERGVLVNTASVAAFDGQIGQAAYAASKGGIVSLTLPLARDLARWGIRVMAIAPGIFGTPMLKALPQAAQDSLGASVPFPKRLGEPREYAELVLFIVRSGYLNGEVIRIDGALRMAPR